MSREALQQLALCAPGCQSRQHGLELNATVLRANFQQIRKLLSLCSNLQNSRDRFGRTPLHIAASIGRLDVISWLLDVVKVDPNTKDLESGWTAMHRAAFYGQLDAMRLLLRCSRVNATSLDREGRTPFDLLLLDLPRHVSYNTTGHGDVFAWGDSSNFGHAGEPFSRKSPEIVEFFSRQHLTVRKVALSNFHVVYLTSNGRLFACGHGLGGRLGAGEGKTMLTIGPVTLPSEEAGAEVPPVLDVDVGDDHTLILSEAGVVYSCGLNEFGALGHSNVGADSSCRYLKPRPVKLRSGKGAGEERVTCIAAGRYHSVLGTTGGVFTFGLNAGQLGHARGERLHSWPRVVAPLSSGPVPTLVAASVGATAVYTKLGDVFVLHRYECKKLARWADVRQLSISGGQLDTSVFSGGSTAGAKVSTSGTDDPLVIAVIVGGPKGQALDYHLALWQASCPGGFRRVRWAGPVRLRDPVHVSISPSCLALVTLNGEGYTAPMATLRVAPAKVPSGKEQVPFAEREEMCELTAKRLSGIYRGVAIAQDRKAKNFAVIQANPGSCLTKIPYVVDSSFEADMMHLREIEELSDIQLKVNSSEWPCHKVVLLAASEVLRALFTRPAFSPPDFLRLNTGSGTPQLVLDCPGLPPIAGDCLVEFLYRGSCRLLLPGFTVEYSSRNITPRSPETPKGGGKKNKKRKDSAPVPRQRRSTGGEMWSGDPVRSLAELARRLGVRRLEAALAQVAVKDSVVELQGVLPKRELQMPRDEPALSLCDAVLVSEIDGSEILAHRCLLAARLEYFRLMFAHSWQESEALEPVRLPLPGEVIALIVEFVYTDDLESARGDLSNTEALCALLGAAEVYQSRRLKELSEELLAARLTLRDCPEILEVTHFYNAGQLKTACFDFLHLNAAAMIEAKQLEGVSDALMEELTAYYREETRQMSRRILRISCPSPTPEDLVLLDSLSTAALEASGDGPPTFDAAALTPEDTSSADLRSVPPSSARRRKRRQALAVRRCSASSDELASPRENAAPEPAVGGPEDGHEEWALQAEEFPSLETEEDPDQGGPSARTPARRSRFRPLSQKELKRRDVEERERRRREEAEAIQEASKPRTLACPWAPKPSAGPVSPATVAPVSLRDVMRSQEAAKPSPPAPAPVPLQTPTRVRTVSASSPAWAELPSSPPAFAEIVREQASRHATAARLSSRPLALIQIEERALAELRQQMAALAASGDLNVRVECVRAEAAAPVWRAKA